MLFDCAVFRLHDEAQSSYEALAILADQFVKAGVVQSDFFMKIWEREQKFPTGLIANGQKYGFAIPHTDYDNVKESTIGFMTLDKPVSFGSMSDPDKTVEVRIIVMLAIKDPQTHVKTLSGIINCLSDPNGYSQILSAGDMASIADIISPYID